MFSLNIQGFDNIYLIGDAAGIGSGLTGEGIYQSLVTGVEVAEYIQGRTEESDDMKAVIRYNRIQEKIMKFLIRIGACRRLVYELIISISYNQVQYFHTKGGCLTPFSLT